MIDDSTRKAFNQVTHYIRKIESDTCMQTFGEWGDAMDAVFVEADNIVRCKDCDNRGSSDCPIEELCTGWLPNDDWFCADGKWKDGEHE